MNNPLFLIAGYGITFLAIVAYLVRLGRMEAEARRAAEAISERK